MALMYNPFEKLGGWFKPEPQQQLQIPIPPPAPVQVQAPAPAPIPFETPGLVVPRAEEPMPVPAPRPTLNYSMDGGPMKEWLPGQTPSKGTYSSPGIVQTPEQKQESIAALDQYDLNTGRYEDIAARHQAFANAAKADAYADAYDEGQFPELMLKQRVGSRGEAGQRFHRIVDPQTGRVVLYDAHEGRHIDTGGLPSPLTGAEATARASMDSSITKLRNVLDLSRSSGGAGSGPYDVMLNTMQQYTGGADPNATKIRQDLQSALNEIIKARAGSAVSQDEARRLMKEAANLYVRDDVFFQQVQNFMDNLAIEYEALRKQRGVGTSALTGSSGLPGQAPAAPAIPMQPQPTTLADKLQSLRNKYNY